jgi:hypothetical protein
VSKANHYTCLLIISKIQVQFVKLKIQSLILMCVDNVKSIDISLQEHFFAMMIAISNESTRPNLPLVVVKTPRVTSAATG